ncbi:MAG: HAD-IIB family hydrolase [Prolixibacteraceae bacterium]
MGIGKNIGLVATDLDGTLLRRDKTVSVADLEMLRQLGEKNIFRVVATGRNFRKTKEVITDDIPFDYVAFSSGAGIYDCRSQQLLYSRNIAVQTVNRLSEELIGKGLSFFLFREVPMNAFSWYYRGRNSCEEFDRYFESHSGLTEKMPDSGRVLSGACQFLVIFKYPDQFLELKDELGTVFDDLKILRASSPFETGYTWMEIFHQDVSKGNAVRFLCDHLNIEREATVGIGNDYNDLDLLDFTSFSYLVENGPEELKLRYRPAPSNENSAFSFCLQRHL